MDSEPAEVNAVEEMEESSEVPKDYDQIRLQSQRSQPRLAEDEPVAIGDEAAGTVCDGLELVQGARINIPA